MSGSINPTSNNQFTAVESPTSADVSSTPVKYMSPDDVIQYVESTLSNIDGQLSDYQAQAMEKNKTANEWRDYKKLVREYTDKDPSKFPTEQPARDQEIARIKTEFAEFEDSTDPDLKTAAKALESNALPPYPDRQPPPAGPDYSAYPDTRDGRALAGEAWNSEVIGYRDSLHANLPKGVTKDDSTALLQTADDTLQSLNQDNELTLMRLNTLMQQRVQVTTKGTEQLASINQCVQAILQNMRS